MSTRAPRDARARRIDDTSAMLLRALRHAAERGSLAADDVVDVARVQLMRPGGPAHKRSEGARARLDEALALLGRQLADRQGPPTPRALYAFARAAAEAAHAIERPVRHPGQRIDERLDDVRALAEAALWAEATRSRDSEDMVRRAVARAVRERKKGRGLVRVRVEDHDPLRTLLDLPNAGRVVLPKNDVRVRLAQAADRTVAFGDALRKAARFSEELLLPVLGDELWELGRPVGFSDKAETRVVIEVPSSVFAQEIKLRSLELLERLRRAPGFERVASIELVVKNARSLPVAGRGVRDDGRGVRDDGRGGRLGGRVGRRPPGLREE